MKQRIEAMGPSYEWRSRFNECEQRFTFLTREPTTCCNPSPTTQQAIAELDQATKEKFELAFHSIQELLRSLTPSSADGAWPKCV